MNIYMQIYMIFYTRKYKAQRFLTRLICRFSICLKINCLFIWISSILFDFCGLFSSCNDNHKQKSISSEMNKKIESKWMREITNQSKC